jgi:hypothetical protein
MDAEANLQPGAERATLDLALAHLEEAARFKGRIHRTA